jgi:hypothetical protein
MQIDDDTQPENKTEFPSFRTSGLYVYGGLTYFESENQVSLSAGEHIVALSVCKPTIDTQFFAEVYRVGEPTGQVVGGILVRSLGWLLLVLGAFAAAVGFLAKRRHNAA